MPNLDWTFYVLWINLLLMKHKLINFDWIVSNLIVCNLLINYLNLIKESIKKQLLSKKMFFEIDVLKNFCNIQRKTPVLECASNKVAGLQLCCEHCEIFKNSFFPKTPPVAAFEKSINFRGKHQWRKCNRFIFLLNTTE